MRPLKALLVSCAVLSAGPASAQVLFSDDFNRPNGPITTSNSPSWEVTSGSFQLQDGVGTSNSPVFRADTKRTDFVDATVSLRLMNNGVPSSGQSFDGFHMMLRRQTEFHLYYVSVNRNRDNVIVIKKKVPGGPSNGGTYYNLGQTVSYPVPLGVWQDVRATVKNESDGSVSIKVYVNDALRASAVDNGVGGPPIRAAGGVGIRGDNLNLRVDNFVVMGSAGGAPPWSGGGPAVDPAQAKAPQSFLTPALADGINDSAVFGPESREVKIVDARGARVFEGSSPSGGIVWNGRDSGGAVVPSGVYIARIETGAGTFYQTLAVAK